jgi:hypothetical protein
LVGKSFQTDTLASLLVWQSIRYPDTFAPILLAALHLLLGYWALLKLNDESRGVFDICPESFAYNLDAVQVGSFGLPCAVPFRHLPGVSRAVAHLTIWQWDVSPVSDGMTRESGVYLSLAFRTDSGLAVLGAGKSAVHECCDHVKLRIGRISVRAWLVCVLAVATRSFCAMSWWHSTPLGSRPSSLQ